MLLYEDFQQREMLGEVAGPAVWEIEDEIS
jgi:hypothetical protein